ncbi:hypothetical protein PInf_011520 [Phytophthora infestans]|nr:hypothetical protein PInf_011520 [Phytophthora infestans]
MIYEPGEDSVDVSSRGEERQHEERREASIEDSIGEDLPDHPHKTVPAAFPDAEDVDPVAIQRERRRQIVVAQDEEQKWSNIKKVLQGQAEELSYKEARDAWKYADRFVLSEDGVLHYLGLNRRYERGWEEETKLRLVVPTAMIQKVLPNCHDSLEGGHQVVVRTFHRVKSDYYWIGLFADVEKHLE